MADIAHIGQAKIKSAKPIVHPLIVRMTHWVNAIAIIVMIMSGLQIQNAYPTFGLTVPGVLTLGGSLTGALRLHFAAMWVLAINGALYLTYGLLSGRFKSKLLPLSVKDFLKDGHAAFSGSLSHADLSRYNAVQRVLYAGIIAVGVLIVLTGLAIWKPVQFGFLTMLFGDFDAARFIHFSCMAAIVLFLAVHVTMALAVPKSLRAMIRGH